MAPARGSTRDRLLAALAALAALTASLDLLANGFVYPLEAARAEIGSHHDLRGPYFGALDLAVGDDPYGGFDEVRASDRLAQRYGIDRMTTLHPPPLLAAFVPLSALRLQRAKVVVLVFGFLCAVASVFALRRALGASGPVSLAVLLFLVGSYRELHRTLDMGQLNAEVLLLVSLGLAALRAGRERLGGGLLALTTLIKPIPGIVLVGLALRGRWRALVGAGAALAVVYGATTLAYGVEPTRDFLGAVGLAAQDVNVSRDNQSLAAAVLRVTMPEPRNIRWDQAPAGSRPVWLALAAAVAGVALWLAARRRVPLELSLSLLLTAGVLVSPRAWNHYLVWLLPGYAAALWTAAQRGSHGLLATVAVSYYLVNQPARAAKILSWALPLPARLLESAQCFGVVLLFVGLAVAVARWRKEPGAEVRAHGAEPPAPSSADGLTGLS